MRTVTYYDADGVARIGLVTQDGVVNSASVARSAGRGGFDDSAASCFAQGQAAFDHLRELADSAGDQVDGHYLGSVDELRLAPTTPNPGKILCVGLNYRRHAAESGMAVPAAPVLFSKFNNALAAHGASVAIEGLTQVDYEAELGVVIGTGGKNIPESRALEHVLGYTNANDVSERVLQMGSGQWLLGKTLDGFLPLGPELVTSDEAGDPAAMRVRGWLNGELRQDSNTADMIFSVAEVIAYASRYMTLQAGDVIVTGTPEGVVLGRQQKDWVVPGDVYEVEIGALGKLTTRFA